MHPMIENGIEARRRTQEPQEVGQIPPGKTPVVAKDQVHANQLPAQDFRCRSASSQ